MNIFMTNPEAVEYGPGQAWLSPHEALYDALQTKNAAPKDGPKVTSRDVYRKYLTERAETLRKLLRKVELELDQMKRG